MGGREEVDEPMNIVIVTPPPVAPVTRTELYSWLRIDPLGSPPEHPDDSMLDSMVAASTAKIEQMTRRALVQQRLRLVLPRFPGYVVRSTAFPEDDDFSTCRDSGIELLRPPFIELHSVSYYDEAGDLQTLAPEAYTLTPDTFCARVDTAAGYSWPATYGRQDAVQIEYTAGYAPVGSPPSDFVANVPDLLKSAVKYDVQLQYDELSPEKRQNIIDAITRCVRSYVVPKF